VKFVSKERLPETGWQNKVADVEQKPSGLTAIALTIFKVLAIPTVIMGCISIYDLFVATPEHNTNTIVGKYVSRGGGRTGTMCAYKLQIKEYRYKEISVPLWFYDDCSPNDTVELSLTPIFKFPKQISLVRSGIVEAKTAPHDKYAEIFIAFGALLPILLFVRSVRDYFGEASSLPYNSGNASSVPKKVIIVVAYFFIIFVCEMVEILNFFRAF
jgi:hypothetical protein